MYSNQMPSLNWKFSYQKIRRNDGQFQHNTRTLNTLYFYSLCYSWCKSRMIQRIHSKTPTFVFVLYIVDNVHSVLSSIYLARIFSNHTYAWSWMRACFFSCLKLCWTEGQCNTLRKMKFCDNTILLGLLCISGSLHTSIDVADDPKIDVQFLLFPC